MAAACGDAGSPVETPAPTDAVSTTDVATTTAAPAETVPPALAAFGTATVKVGGEEWLVAVADERDERIQGLREVGDLGALDGMIFVYDVADVRGFTMSTVPIPLEIGFFGADGVLDQVLRMEPCSSAESECPGYVPDQPFRWAIETEVGGWDGVEVGAELVVSG